MGVLQISSSSAKNARIIGSGSETLVLAHGYGGNQSLWDKVIPTLAQRYQVLVFDWNFSDPVKYPSSFDDYANDLIALVEELKLNSVVFIGHSMSGMIGCLASIKRGDLFKSLILLCASPRYLNCEDYEGGLEKPQLEEILTNIENNFETWASYFASMVVDPKDPPSAEKFGECLAKMNPGVALSLAKLVFCSDLSDMLEKVHVPCTIIQTTNDFVVPMSVAYYIQKKMVKCNSTVEIIDGEGHFPQLTHTKLLLEVIDRALECNN